MKKQTVLITGTSTGIGRAAALEFQRKGWNVVATMRSPEKERELGALESTLVTRLDVTDAESIRSAIQAGVKRFGRIDAIVNNAGYGLSGPFETTDSEQVQRQFATNVFGLMDVTREILPLFRAQGSGTVVNVASMGGRITWPLYSVYHSTKYAVEGFSESLHYELSKLGIRVKLIEPGAIKTDFYSRSADRSTVQGDGAHEQTLNRAITFMNGAGDRGTSAEAVARTIVRAASDKSARMRYLIGPDARFFVFLRKLLPESLYFRVVRAVVLK